MNKNYIDRKKNQKNHVVLASQTFPSFRLKKVSLVLLAFFMAINLQAQVNYSSASGSLSLSSSNKSVILGFASPIPANTVVYINVSDNANLSGDAGPTNSGTDNSATPTTTQLNGPNNTEVLTVTSSSSFQYVKITISGNNTATVNSAFYTALNIADCGMPIATTPDQAVTFFSVGKYNDNTSYAIDNDTTTASDFSLNVVATGTLAQTIILNGPSNLGDGVSILYQIPTGITVALFGGVSFQAYSGSTPVGDAQNLANLVSILGIGRTTNRTRLTFYPNATSSQTFDRIVISFDFGVSVGFGAQALIYDVERVPAIPLLSNASYTVCSPVVGNAVATPAQNVNGVGPLAYTWYKADGITVAGTTSTADNISAIPFATLFGSSTPTAGTYTFTVKVHKANCTSANTDPSSTQTVVISSANTSTPMLLSAGTLGATLNLVTTCANASGYIAFVDPNNVNKKYMAINPNGNTGYSFSTTAINNLLSTVATNGVSATAIGRRLYTVVDAGTNSYTTNGGMKVRIYFDPADTVTARSLVPISTGAVKSNSWFKVPTSTVLTSALTALGISNAINLNSKATTGSESGINYVEFSGIQSFSTFGFIAANGTSGILPISGMTLTGTLIGGIPQLSWTTITEVNSNYFSIESSTDGSTFTSIGKIAAAGNSNSALSYSYTDRLASGAIVYYRLKEIDKDGTASYSNTIAINLGTVATAFKVFPNPVSNLLNIQTTTDGTYSVELYSIDGKKVQAAQLTTGGGLMTLNINKINVPTGIYSVKVTNVNGKSSSSYSTVLIK